MLIALIFIFLGKHEQTCAQTWSDSLDTYAREKYLPPSTYHWNWMNASLLYTMIKQYDYSPEQHKKLYLDYVHKAMDKTYSIANGKIPDAVASGSGMALLARITGDEKYKKACKKIYSDYKKIKRTQEGGVSHLRKDLELWDDTIFMIGQFLLEMYKATGDAAYIDELVLQIRVHRDKLQNKEWGLWVHGWDSDQKSHCTFCGQLNWPDKTTGKSAEIWGRGNGWIIVTLSDALETIPKSHPQWAELAGYLKEMIAHLPELQNKENGHWYQLPTRPLDPKNFIESSSTAMFSFGITKAIELGIVTDSSFKKSIDLAYNGLREYSIKQISEKYLTTKNVCKGTCIGDKDYYLKRKVKDEKPYSIGMFIRFGHEYERMNNLLVK